MKIYLSCGAQKDLGEALNNAGAEHRLASYYYLKRMKPERAQERIIELAGITTKEREGGEMQKVDSKLEKYVLWIEREQKPQAREFLRALVGLTDNISRKWNKEYKGFFGWSPARVEFDTDIKINKIKSLLEDMVGFCRLDKKGKSGKYYRHTITIPEDHPFANSIKQRTVSSSAYSLARQMEYQDRG